MRNSLLMGALFWAASASAAPAAIIGFGGNGTGFTLTKGAGGNGPSVTSDVLTLTDNNNSEGNAAFFNTPQSDSPFIASFVYQDVGAGGGDGFTFTLQNDPRGTAAVGDAGALLGYGGGAEITPSFATDFNIYGGSGGSKSGFTTNGTINYATIAPLDLASGHPIVVTIRYDGTSVTENLVDPIAEIAFGTSPHFFGPLSAILGGPTAFVGFTGGTAEVNANQTISDFSYSNVLPEPASLAFLSIAGVGLSARRRK